MPEQRPDTAPPLPDRPLIDEDHLDRWLRSQTVSAQKLITGSLQAGQEIGSANFSSGSAGWQIDGDGNAEFNDVTVRGTLEASLFRTASSGARLEIDGADGDKFVSMYDSGGNLIAKVGIDTGEAGIGASDMNILNTSGDIAIETDQGSGRIELTTNGGSTQVQSTGQLTLGVGGSSSNPALSFGNDIDTGLYRGGSDNLRLVAGGTDFLSANATQFVSGVIRDATTGSAANININATSGLMQRSTSSLRYKPDWQWARDAADYVLPTPIRWTDEEGQVRLGFGAEHVHEVVPEAYEEEIYDLRSLVAILSEKVKRLESRPRWLRRLRAFGS